MQPCKLWHRAVGAHGYGVLRHAGRTVTAHRLAYAQHHGLDVFTMGGVVMHKCDVRACVEPTHLHLGTHASNSADMVAKGRQATGRKCHGGQVKLTAEAVAYCREHYVPKHPTYGARALARRFGVAHPQISRAVAGLSWSTNDGP